MAKVSVLVPMYGVERYIAVCARSLFSQSYANCEFIFVDDASRDGSLQQLRLTVEEFAQVAAQVKIVELAQNGGVAAARNAALDAASGDYVLFVDADDWVDSRIVERLVARAHATDADICNAWCVSATDNNRFLHTPTSWFKGDYTHICAVIEQSHIVPNHVRGMLFRRSLFEENKLRFTPRVDFGEDYSLLPQLLYYARNKSTLKEYLYFYRIENEDSYMNNIGEKQINNYVAAQVIVSEFIASLPDSNRFTYSLLVGRLNLKKWIFRRGKSPRDYNAAIFGKSSLPKFCLTLRLYDWALDNRLALLIWLLSVVINIPALLTRSLQFFDNSSR